MPFERFLFAITEKSPEFRHELELRVKAAAVADWHNVVSALCTENISTSPSYRAILLGNEGDAKQRDNVHKLAIEFNGPDTSSARKVAIGREIAQIVWENVLSSSLAVVMESGIGMDIDASGKNRIATGAGGSRAGATNAAWEAIKSNTALKSPLVLQVERCSNFLAKGVGIDAIASTVVSFAQKAEQIDEEYFYPQIEVQLQESRKNLKECNEINKELYLNEKAWGSLTQKPEASFITTDKTTKAPHAVMELEEHMREQLKQKQPHDSSSSGMADKDKHLKK